MKTIKKKWYREICIGIRKICKIGSSYGIIIPKGYFDSKTIDIDKEYIVILLSRDRQLTDEMSKKEMIQFEQFKKMKKKERDVIDNALKILDTY